MIHALIASPHPTQRRAARTAAPTHPPFLNTMTVGMLRMPYSVATLGLSSVFSFSCTGRGRGEEESRAGQQGGWGGCGDR